MCRVTKQKHSFPFIIILYRRSVLFFKAWSFCFDFSSFQIAHRNKNKLRTNWGWSSQKLKNNEPWQNLLVLIKKTRVLLTFFHYVTLQIVYVRNILNFYCRWSLISFSKLYKPVFVYRRFMLFFLIKLPWPKTNSLNATCISILQLCIFSSRVYWKRHP